MQLECAAAKPDIGIIIRVFYGRTTADEGVCPLRAGQLHRGLPGEVRVHCDEECVRLHTQTLGVTLRRARRCFGRNGRDGEKGEVALQRASSGALF